MTKRALIVEDDGNIAELLRLYLGKDGFEVMIASDGGKAESMFDLFAPDVVLLDIMLPVKDGWQVCKDIRRKSSVPIIMLTAKGETNDKVNGLEMGADDYVTKPFEVKELLARIRAVLRRQANELPGAPSQEEAVIAFGKFKLNLGTREMFREDEPMPLTSGEFAVLKALVSHPREPLSRDKLMNLARGREYSAMERSIDVQISRLRRMVEEDPAHPRYIQTVWGLGYVFVPDGSKA